ncbi:MAG TPA: hypothetical protein VHO23_02590 [Candidatus Paceibacterota bacterium]|nr:hypothetical protein [Candidatus Paceibacterota bacterium]
MQFLVTVLSICAIGLTCYVACLSYGTRRLSLRSPITYIEVAFIAVIAFALISVITESRLTGLGFALAIIIGFAYSLLERCAASFRSLFSDEADADEELIFLDPRPASAWRRKRKSIKGYQQIGPSNAAIGMTPYDTRLNLDLTGQLLDFKA